MTIVVCGFVAVLLALRSNILESLRPASFYYRLPVENDTSYDFLRVSLVQLTDAMRNKTTCPFDIQVIARAHTQSLAIKGDCDSPSTLFVLTAYASDQNGVQSEIPLDRVFVKLIPFALFRSNTFADGSSVNVLRIEEEDLIPVASVGFSPESEDDATAE